MRRHPLGNTGGGPAFEDPQSTPFIIGEAVEGLHVGDLAPDFDIALPDGTTYQLHDVDGNPVSLEDLRGKAVWINFFASWCPPCQGETPVLREVAEKYKDQGLEVVAVSVQETTADDVREYRDRYDLDFTVGFDGSGHVFHQYRVYALPTQFFVDPDGAIRSVAQGPLSLEGASQRVEGDPAGADRQLLSRAGMLGPRPTSSGRGAQGLRERSFCHGRVNQSINRVTAPRDRPRAPQPGQPRLEGTRRKDGISR